MGVGKTWYTEKEYRKTVMALEGSIEKWEWIVHEAGEDLGPDNCPLCQLYFGGDCESCPVAIYTNNTRCRNTPYDEWSYLLDEYNNRALNEFFDSGVFHTISTARTAELRSAAEAELDFLKKLYKYMTGKDYQE